MTATDPAALRDELRQLEGTIEETRRTADEVRREVGQREDGPYDDADVALLLTEAEQQEQLLSTLEARRASLLQRLREATAAAPDA